MNDLCVRAVPDSQGAIVSAGNDDGHVGRYVNTIHVVSRSGESTLHATVVGVVHAHDLVAGCGYDELALSDETHGGDLFLVSRNVAFSVASDGVPELDPCVRTTTGEALSIGSPTDSQDVVGMSFELE